MHAQARLIYREIYEGKSVMKIPGEILYDYQW